MFKELDDDESGTVSCEEISMRFKLKYDVNHTMQQVYKKIRENKYYTSHNAKQIKDFENMDMEDFIKFSTYEIVDLSPYQNSQIKLIELREAKAGGLNETGSKSGTNNERSLVKH